MVGVLARQGGQHDRHGPGRRPDGPLDDGEVPDLGRHRQRDDGRRPAAAGTATTNSLSNLYPTAKPLYPEQSAAQQMNTPKPVKFVNIDQIDVKAASADEIPKAISEIETLLRERHGIREGDESDFYIRDMSEFQKALGSTSELMGAPDDRGHDLARRRGVGIMNIMLVSVTERTREIGLRMAVGARGFHILRQFLIESIVLCLFGGVVGILLGRIASTIVWYILRWPIEPSLFAIIGACAVSAAVGIGFGFYPAWKASRLDPIEAAALRVADGVANDLRLLPILHFAFLNLHYGRAGVWREAMQNEKWEMQTAN